MADQVDPQAQPLHTLPESPSLGVALELAPGALDNQAAQVDALDAKAGFVLGSASLLVGVLTAWRVQVHAPGIVIWLPPIAAIVAYGAVIFCGFKGYTLRSYKYAPSPTILKAKALPVPPEETRRQVFNDIVQAFADNEEVIQTKTTWLNRAFLAFVVQAVVVAAILLLETWAISG